MSQMEERIWQPGNIEVELRGVGAHVAQSGEWEFGINTIFLTIWSSSFRSLQLFQAGLKCHHGESFYVCNINPPNITKMVGPLLFVFDEAIFQHEIRNFGLFQAKTSDYGL